MRDVERRENLLGALVVALADRLDDDTHAVVGHSGGASSALVTIAQYPGGTIEELRRAIHLSHAATVRIVDRLVARGLVRRRSGARGPAVALSTTSDGKRMAREILATRKRILESVLPPLSDEEAATLTTVLERMLVRLAEEPARSASICRLCDSACRRHRCPVAETQRAIGRTVPDPVPLESNE